MQPLLRHAGQFAKYVFSGSAAAVVDIGGYFLLLHFGAWYIAANLLSGILAFFTAFLMHKYVVFKKNDQFLKHLRRYFVVDMTNLAIITVLLYLLVDIGSVDEVFAKFAALAPVVLWNFFVYKMFVYV